MTKKKDLAMNEGKIEGRKEHLFLPSLSFDHLHSLLPIIFFRSRDQSSAFQYGSSTINYWQLPGFSESRDDDVRRR